MSASPKPARASYFMGIDAGGTKTVAVVGHGDGRVASRGESGAGNPIMVGIDEAVGNIVTAIHSALGKYVAARLIGTYIGVAGGGNPSVKAAVEAGVRGSNLTIAGPLRVHHDLLIALHSGNPPKKSIVAVLGTGSAAMGVSADGEEILAGGWSQLLGETGGYQIGMRAIGAATRASDGRGVKTVLEEIVRHTWELSDLRDLSLRVSRGSLEPGQVAGLAPAVMRAAADGDAAAGEIMTGVVEEMNASVMAVAQRLDYERGFAIVLVGGLFRGSFDLAGAFERRVLAWATDVEFIVPVEEPATVALRLARQIAGSTPAH